MLLLPCTAAALPPDVLERCCDVGRLWFTTNRERCSIYPSTVPRVRPADRATCTAVIDLCCMSQRQERQCALGKQSARLQRTCAALSSRPGSEHARVRLSVRLLQMLLNITLLFSGFKQSSMQSLSVCHAICRFDRQNSQQQRRLQANSSHLLGRSISHPTTPFAAQWVAVTAGSQWRI